MQPLQCAHLAFYYVGICGESQVSPRSQQVPAIWAIDFPRLDNVTAVRTSAGLILPQRRTAGDARRLPDRVGGPTVFTVEAAQSVRELMASPHGSRGSGRSPAKHVHLIAGSLHPVQYRLAGPADSRDSAARRSWFDPKRLLCRATPAPRAEWPHRQELFGS